MKAKQTPQDRQKASRWVRRGAERYPFIVINHGDRLWLKLSGCNNKFPEPCVAELDINWTVWPSAIEILV